mmetsp:Transcript_229/g.244  ORF Transcript_229/g.244 Transcript_229/m.244 type:complete len:84 (-) Transcript_229:677-928(-)
MDISNRIDYFVLLDYNNLMHSFFHEYDYKPTSTYVLKRDEEGTENSSRISQHHPSRNHTHTGVVSSDDESERATASRGGKMQW